MAIADTRLRIFGALVNAQEVLTTAEIAKKLKVAHQKIHYHIPFLIESGLIVESDGGGYFCQPCFIDEELKEKFTDSIIAITKDIVDMIYVEGDDEERENAANNCVSAFVSCLLAEITSNDNS